MVGREFGLGQLAGVSLDRDYPLLLVTGWIAVPAGAVCLVFSAIAAAGIAVGAVFIAVGLSRRKVRGWLARYAGGYAQVVMADPRPRVVRWADVTEVTFTISRNTVYTDYGSMTSTSLGSFTARPFLGPAMPVPGRVDAARARAGALRAVGDRLIPAMTAAYDAGEAVAFGAVQVSQSGVVLPGLTAPVPWAEIRSVRLRAVRLTDPGRSRITSSVSLACSGRPRRRSIDLSGLPNGLFLPGLLQHAAARQQVKVTGTAW